MGEPFFSVGSISAVLSSPVRNAGSFSEQRLVIQPFVYNFKHFRFVICKFYSCNSLLTFFFILFILVTD